MTSSGASFCFVSKIHIDSIFILLVLIVDIPNLQTLELADSFNEVDAKEIISIIKLNLYNLLDASLFHSLENLQ